MRRLRSWYLHTANAADQAMNRESPSFPLAPLSAGCPPLSFQDRCSGLAWCETEQANLIAVIQLAASTGDHTTTWQLSAVLVPYFTLPAQVWALLSLGFVDQWFPRRSIVRWPLTPCGNRARPSSRGGDASVPR
ncbi:hypothetical protein [Streptomyces cinnamoneus]|uniref:Uncharacterized protein n=1 Tax=Streptomyces cinnamoneus TaxID=53446 RepID=A0A918TD60_STRCJ|nr:hypothetical protein [Streptomyces cinnamoneus]GHC38355.1 hypothetical protein GCM10010507_09810 [Streptomyces cinnamoneus]